MISLSSTGQNPRQLLDIFAELEEQNLFLIQNSQETEEELEELRNKFRHTQSTMNAEIATLNSQIETLDAVVVFEDEKKNALQNRARDGEGHDLGAFVIQSRRRRRQ